MAKKNNLPDIVDRSDLRESVASRNKRTSALGKSQVHGQKGSRHMSTLTIRSFVWPDIAGVKGTTMTNKVNSEMGPQLAVRVALLTQIGLFDRLTMPRTDLPLCPKAK